MSVTIGRTRWVIAGGFVPVRGTGPEPAFTSNDAVSVLNAGDDPVDIEILVHFTDTGVVGPFCLEVGARRIRRFRVNDLIDPQALPLGVPYAVVLDASAPVVVQFTRQDTRQESGARMGSIAFPLH